MIVDPNAYMDHSGGDELTGNPNAVHSTAVLMSSDGSVFAFADKIKPIITTHSSDLGKWSKRSAKYRQKFASALVAALPGSGVFVYAFALRESTIISGWNQAINELRLAKMCLESVDGKGRRVCRFGPFINNKNQKIEIQFRKTQAMVLLGLIQFLVRCQRHFFDRLRESAPQTIEGVLHLFLNKFANNNPACSKSSNFLQGVTHSFFPVRTNFFHDTKEVEAELLPDNIAGLLREYALDQARYPNLITDLLGTGVFYFESDI